MPPKKASKRRAKDAVRPARTHANHVYGELIAEAGSAAVESSINSERPLKRPRLGHKPQNTEQDERAADVDDIAAPASELQDGFQHISIPHTDTEVESIAFDEDSGLDFEDVVIDQHISTADETLDSDHDVNIVVPTTKTIPASASSTTHRSSASKIPKATRILAHKAHLVALIGHCMIANSRCNDYGVQRRVRRLLPSTVRTLLNPDETASQFQQSHSLTKGLERAIDIFKGAFRVNASGISRAWWKSPEECNSDVAAWLDNADYRGFRAAAQSLSGSQDVGTQLFCAMLRSVGVKTRLVCSLQVLPLSTSQSRRDLPGKHSATVALTITPDRYLANGASQAHHHASKSTSTFRKLAYPVFWTEVFDLAYQKWLPVDPIVTRTIKKPTKLGPPTSYEFNQMAYVLAFDADGSVKDITRRYARSFNAKTRRLRLESLGTEHALWLRRLLRSFRPLGRRSDCAEIEDAELSRREVSEGMPKNVLDFAGHPVYALERHLRKSEVIHPRREVGKVNTGTAAKPNMEPIFRRQDVHACRTAEQWFRLGRAIRPGAQPLKLAPARRHAGLGQNEDQQSETAATMGMYSLPQTELFIPDRVSRGRIPRNAFGNVDVYVPSMVPPGGSHIRHRLAKDAAAILQVDAADAVVGFKFSGRRGTAIIEGAVVPTRYHDAVNAVIEGLQWGSVVSQCQARSLLSLRLWKKFLQGLEIRRRVAAYGPGEGTDDSALPLETGEHTETQGLPQDDELFTAGRYNESELVALLTIPKPRAPERAGRRIIEDSSSSSDTDAEAASNTTPIGHFAQQGLAGEAERNSIDLPSQNVQYPAGEDGQQDANTAGGFLVDDDDDGEHAGAASLSYLLASSRDHYTEQQPHDLRPDDDGDRSESPQRNQGQSSQAQSMEIAQSRDHDMSSQHAHVSEADNESRLSHDPEDDDADPDWLASE